MILHTTVISYERGDLLERCVESYLATVTLPYTLVVVDNGSAGSTRRVLYRLASKRRAAVLLLGENRWPGHACNQGWRLTPPAATHLHRSDNDFEYLPGWCDAVADAFADPRTGQVGLRTDEEELRAPWNVGGNCVVSRAVWDAGVRWDERSWHELGATTEDYYMTQAVQEAGFGWGRVARPCIVPISYESPDDPYYQASWGARGIHGI